jgi:trans-aconitate 2-methyltransferase
MPEWNPTQYLKFAAERTRPCRDLASRIFIRRAHRIIDLGSGPGNSTEVLASFWPEAELTALDSSSQMVEIGRERYAHYRWIHSDIQTWALESDDSFDMVFSNAALQWVPDHATYIPKLFDRVNSGGVLAFQMPADINAPAHQLMREIASAPVREWYAHDLPWYYDLLSDRALSVDSWETTYMHVVTGAEDIVEWYKGTGLRPYLEAAKTEDQKARFLNQYLEGIRKLYPARQDGRVFFPFRRIFVLAYRR